MKKSSTSWGWVEPPVFQPKEPLAQGSGPFRDNVGALILRRIRGEVHILLGERTDTPGFKQWPQGGREEGESELACLQRELMEEVGCAEVRILHQLPFKPRYRFPQALAAKMKPYIGQEQNFFVMEMEGEPDLEKATSQEFSALYWEPLNRVLSGAIWFKRPLYRQVLTYLEWAMGSGQIQI